MHVQLDLMEVDLITLLAHVHNGVEHAAGSVSLSNLLNRQDSQSAEGLDRDAKFSGQNVVLLKFCILVNSGRNIVSLKFCILVNSGQQRFTPQTGTDQLESDIGSMHAECLPAVT